MSEVAEAQHGVVARRQLLELGMSGRSVDRRLERGILHRIHRGVYAVGYRKLTKRGLWLAAVLACGRNAVLSHRSAGESWGLLPPSNRRTEVSRATGWCGPKGVFLHRSAIPSDEREEVDGIPVTSATRTILDLAAVVSGRELGRALNEMEVRQLRVRLSLPELLERYSGRRGTAVLRRALEDPASSLGVPEKGLEERFLELVAAEGLPPPRVNGDLRIRGRFIRPDFAWPTARLIVETDGGAAHHTRRAFEADRERDRLLASEGWRVIRVTWRQLRDAPRQVSRDIRMALARDGHGSRR